jgi:acetylornithine/N-succinyldiaminopimelate aminotransferase
MLNIATTTNLLNSYNRSNIVFEHGIGSELFDKNGNRYIDLLAGIAVLTLGHSHPKIISAINSQSNKLIHVCNLFHNEPAINLAKYLTRSVGEDYKVFFCNSGTEANECAIKLARRWGGLRGKFKILSAHNSFHGRTYGSLAATGQSSKSDLFHPLPSGFNFADYNNLESFREKVDEETAAIILEPIQGEGGIVVGENDFLIGIKKLCEESGCLLIFDEIQCGMGRTGSIWNFERLGIKPDILTSAKGLGGGLPIGACIISDIVASTINPGEHGSTFGGGSLVTHVALEIFKSIDD